MFYLIWRTQIFLQKWAEIRTQGFLKYLLKRTLIWAIVLIGIQLILNYFLEILDTRQIISGSLTLLTITISGFAGKWNYNEKEYKKFMYISK